MSKQMRRYGFARGWVPASDAVLATPDSLLRADNLIFDPNGGMRLRRGTRRIQVGTGSPVTSMHSVIFDDPATDPLDQQKQRAVATAEGNLFIDGVNKGIAFDGYGDIALASGLGHLYAARGTVGKKWNGSNLYNWAVTKPTKAPTIAANSALALTVATFASGESPAPSVIQGASTGTPTYVAGYSGTANAAVSGVPDAQGRYVIRKLWTSDQDLFNIQDTEGDDTDLFDIWVAFDTPEEFDYLEIVFGCDASNTDPFRQDAFTFKFQPQKVVDVKDANLTMRRVLDQMQESAHDPGSGDHLEDPIPDDYPSVETVVAGVGMIPVPRGPVSTTRWDSVGASPAWVHFTVPRSSFDRVGNTPGRGWATIRGFQVVYKTKASGQTGKVYLDDMVILGGGIRAYTGTFRFRYRFVRDDGRFLDMSPPSDPSDPITVNQQGFTVTIPDEALVQMDPQLNQIWVYIYGGFMDGYYRCARLSTTSRSPASMGLSEFQLVADGSDVNHNYDRGRFMAFTGITMPTGGSYSLSVKILRGEMDVLADNVYLEPGVIPLPSDIIDIAGPYQNRMWALTRGGGVYPTMKRKPGTFRIYDAVSVGSKSTIPLWIRTTSNGVYVGTTKDVYRISGTGNTREDGSVDFTVDSLGLGTPPFGDLQACQVGSQMFFRAAETIEQFNGSSTQSVNQLDIKPLVDGEFRYGIPPWDRRVGARYRMTFHEGYLCILVPEFVSSEVAVAQSTFTMYRAAIGTGRWLRHTFPFALTALHVEPDGTMLGGSSTGDVYVLDDSESTADDSTLIPFTLWSPEDYDGLVMHRKDWEDLHVFVDSANNNYVRTQVYSQDTLLLDTGDIESAQTEIIKVHLASLSACRSIQLRITGQGYYGTTISGFQFNYQPRPEHRWDIDCATIAPVPRNITGVRELRFFGQIGADVQVTPYHHGVAQTPITVTAVPGVFKLYRVKLGRQLQGQPRFRLATVQPNDTSENGMEIVFVELRYTGEGTDTDKSWRTVYSSNGGQ